MSTTFVARAGLETAPLQDGSVLYDAKTGKFIMLNRSAAFLWAELSTPRTEDELGRLLCASFPGVAAPGSDVGQALERLRKLELVEGNGETVAAPATASAPAGPEPTDKANGYEPPSFRPLDEDELLNIFQMTAAEISVASCWWGACPVGCP